MSSRWLPRISGGGLGGSGGDTLAGDVTGPLLANTVEAIQGNPVSAAAPAVGDVFEWTGALWAPTPGAAAGSSLISAAGAYTVPGAVAVGDIVYSTGSFTADVADRTAPATMPAIGVVVAKPIATTATILYYGEAAVFGGLTPGAEYFVGVAGAVETPGTNVSGEVVQRIGVAISATTILVTPDPTTTNL
jgi:hypothetical protein